MDYGLQDNSKDIPVHCFRKEILDVLLHMCEGKKLKNHYEVLVFLKKVLILQPILIFHSMGLV